MTAGTVGERAAPVKGPGLRCTQRERILDGMTRAAAQEGYAHASIAKTIATARVSRPTFYEYFTDKDDCFLTALKDALQPLVAQARESAEGAAPEHALSAVIRAVAEFARSGGPPAQLVLARSLAAGPRAARIRAEGLAELASIVEARYGLLESTEAAADVPTAMLIGGVQRLLARRLRSGELDLRGLLEALEVLTSSYRTPIGAHRWRSLEANASISPTTCVPPTLPPSPLPPGRPRLSGKQVAENHRQRIVFAAAEVCARDGYGAVRVSEITRAAGVDGRVFHALFSDRAQLFVEVHEMHFQRLMAVCSSAFFSAESWPERVWHAGLAFSSCLQQNPCLARVSFVEGYAGEPAALERVQAAMRAFQVFFQDGYRCAAEGQDAPTPVAVDAITAMIFEIVYQQSLISFTPRITGLLPDVTYLVLAPFVGVASANAFIDGALAAEPG